MSGHSNKEGRRANLRSVPGWALNESLLAGSGEVWCERLNKVHRASSYRGKVASACVQCRRISPKSASTDFGGIDLYSNTDFGEISPNSSTGVSKRLVL